MAGIQYYNRASAGEVVQGCRAGIDAARMTSKGVHVTSCTAGNAVLASLRTRRSRHRALTLRRGGTYLRNGCSLRRPRSHPRRRRPAYESARQLGSHWLGPLACGGRGLHNRRMATPRSKARYTAAEFFAGIGLVGEALGSEGIEVVYANDIDPIKERLFVANYDRSVFHRGDIRQVRGRDVPHVDLATASFPCTDVSLAGGRAGLKGEQSGMFWEFARILEEMGNRRPRTIMLENVVGLCSSNGGEDLRAAFKRLNDLGYYCDLIYGDARWFLPQSRPRLFIVGSLLPLDSSATGPTICSQVRPPWFAAFVAQHPDLKVQTMDVVPPAGTPRRLDDVVERLPTDDERWWDSRRARAFLESLSDINAARLDRLRESVALTWRTAYRRTRNGRPVWEIRPDQISGCLRTARGGSSKQAVVEAGDGRVRVRWMTAREYARLQGAPNFNFDDVSESQAMFGFGDAVCVPVVEWIVASCILPLLDGSAVECAEQLAGAAAL